MHEVVTFHAGHLRWREANGAGIVDNDINPAKGFNRFVDSSLHVFFMTNIDLNRQRLTACGFNFFGSGKNCAR